MASAPSHMRRRLLGIPLRSSSHSMSTPCDVANRRSTAARRASRRARSRPFSWIAGSSPRPSHLGARIRQRADDAQCPIGIRKRQGVVVRSEAARGTLRATSRASSRAAPSTAPPTSRFEPRRYGSSNSPSCSLSRSTRRTDASIMVHRHQAALERDRQTLAISLRHHVDVDPGLQRQHRGFDEIGRHAVFDELARSRCSR